MGSKDYGKTNEMYLDVLKEVGNIGAGNVITALSQRINTRLYMTPPIVKVLGFNELAEVLGGAENPVVGILFSFSGQINGIMLFVLEQKTAHNLVNMLIEKKLESIEDITEKDIAVLYEAGRIIAESYVDALSFLTQLTINISVPSVSLDMAGAILSVPAIEFGEMGEHALLVATEFNNKLERVYGHFILVPEVESYGKILMSLGFENGCN